MNQNKSDILNKVKKRFKLPIVLHLYFVLLLVATCIVLLILFILSRNVNEYIADACSTEINNSVSTYSENWNLRPVFSDENWVKEFGTSVDGAAECSVSILKYNSKTYDCEIVYPNNCHENTKLFKMCDYLPASSFEATTEEPQYLLLDEVSSLYYSLINLDHIEGDFNYYLLFYTDTSTYDNFASTLIESLYKIMLITIFIAGAACIIFSTPIILSIYRMARYARRIAKGDFSPNNSLVISKEMQDLSDNMNYMARKLNENDREQKTFFQNASHELRTPLMSIQGYAEGLQYDVFEGEDRKQAIEVILSECNRLSNLVENLLSISKMDMVKSGNFEVKKKQINLYELINHEIENIRGTFMFYNKELIQKVDVKDKFILANDTDIYRMLDNIFSNCLRYAKSKVYFNSVITDDDFVLFQIYDDGVGISEEVMANLFTRFAKGDEGKHGIGLSLVKLIAEAHDGNIKAYNKEGYGACFEIRIPCESPKIQLTNQSKLSD